MKDCKKIHPLLSLHLEGALSQKEKTLVEKHLEVCITARREREQFERMRKAILAQPTPEPPVDLHERIMGHLGMASQTPLRRVQWGRPFMLAAAMLMVALFLNRYPEWQKEALSPSKEKTSQPPAAWAPEKDEVRPLTKPIVNEEPSRDEKLAKVSTGRTKKAVAARAQAPAQNFALDAENRKDSSTAGAGTTGDLTEEKTEANEPSTSEARSAAAPAPAMAPPAHAEAEKNLNTLTLSREVSGLYWKGDNGPSEAHAELISDGPSFSRIWESLRPDQKDPAVDFEKNSVVFLTAGSQPTTGYSLLVTGLQDKEDELVVRYKVKGPPAGSMAAQMITRPWSLQAIPRPSKPVLFQKEE